MGVSRGVDRPAELRAAAILNQFERHRRLVELRADLGVADQRLMWLFSDAAPRTLREIAEELGLEQSTVNRQVNAALREGLLERSKDSGQPAAVFTATEDGLSRFRRDLDFGLGRFAEGLEAIPPGDRDRFLAQLASFVDAFSAGVDRETTADPS